LLGFSAAAPKRSSFSSEEPVLDMAARARCGARRAPGARKRERMRALGYALRGPQWQRRCARGMLRRRQLCCGSPPAQVRRAGRSCERGTHHAARGLAAPSARPRQRRSAPPPALGQRLCARAAQVNTAR
jgi:hypothetical protein